jgi:HAD superfamily hydrolase (TIGR01509 family)
MLSNKSQAHYVKGDMMKFYRYMSVSFLIMMHTTHGPNNNNTNVNAPKKVIIFDLTNVLVKENQAGFAKKIGYGVLANYTITHWKNPGYRCLDMLAAMSNHATQKPDIIIKLKNRTMPRSIVELQKGTKTCAQARSEIAQAIEMLDAQKFFSSTKEKKLMTTIMDLILDPATIASVVEPIKPMVQLVHKLKSAGHKIYICANVPPELFATAEQRIPSVIQQCNGIVLSYHIQSVKPNQALLQHLLTQHNLNPTHCILIDDLEESAATARTLGMQAIVYDKPLHIIGKLKKYGITV